MASPNLSCSRFLMRPTQMSDVDADPAAVETLRGGHGSAAAAEWIENHIALVGARLDDAFEQRFRLLGWIAETLLGKVVHDLHVSPYILHRNSRKVLGVLLQPRHTALLSWPMNPSRRIQLIQFWGRV